MNDEIRKILKNKKKKNKLFLYSNVYASRFISDMCEGYSYSMRDRSKHLFYSFEPKNSNVAKLFMDTEYGFVDDGINQIIDATIKDLIIYGRSAILLRHKNVEADAKAEDKKAFLPALCFAGLETYMHKKDNSFFCSDTVGVNDNSKHYNDYVIMFDLKDLGYRRNYFYQLIKRFEKYDLSASVGMVIEKAEGYDFSVHQNHNDLKILKLTKEVGWYLDMDELSDSHFLYRKRLQTQFKLTILDYVINKINEAIRDFIPFECDGELVAYANRRDYDNTWHKFQDGDVSLTEMRNELFQG